MQGGVPSPTNNDLIIPIEDDSQQEEEDKKPKYILEDVLDYNQRKG